MIYTRVAIRDSNSKLLIATLNIRVCFFRIRLFLLKLSRRPITTQPAPCMQGDKNQKNKPESVDLRYAKTAAGAANLLPLNERPVKYISLLSTAVRSAARLHYMAKVPSKVPVSRSRSASVPNFNGDFLVQ